MKKLLAALLLLPSLANAGFCDAVYDFAEATMSLRQDGYPKRTAKLAVEETRAYDRDLADMLEANVDWAYSFQIYKGNRKKTIAVEFADKSYQICKEEEARMNQIKESY